jgi:hypothetical protein
MDFPKTNEMFPQHFKKVFSKNRRAGAKDFATKAHQPHPTAIIIKQHFKEIEQDGLYEKLEELWNKY